MRTGLLSRSSLTASIKQIGQIEMRLASSRFSITETSRLIPATLFRHKFPREVPTHHRPPLKRPGTGRFPSRKRSRRSSFRIFSWQGWRATPIYLRDAGPWLSFLRHAEDRVGPGEEGRGVAGLGEEGRGCRGRKSDDGFVHGKVGRATLVTAMRLLPPACLEAPKLRNFAGG